MGGGYGAAGPSAGGVGGVQITHALRGFGVAPLGGDGGAGGFVTSNTTNLNFIFAIVHCDEYAESSWVGNRFLAGVNDGLAGWRLYRSGQILYAGFYDNVLALNSVSGIIESADAPGALKLNVTVVQITQAGDGSSIRMKLWNNGTYIGEAFSANGPLGGIATYFGVGGASNGAATITNPATRVRIQGFGFAGLNFTDVEWTDADVGAHFEACVAAGGMALLGGAPSKEFSEWWTFSPDTDLTPDSTLASNPGGSSLFPQGVDVIANPLPAGANPLAVVETPVLWK